MPPVRDEYFQYLPAITEQTQSIVVSAAKLPVRIRRPYYTIRTDILDSSKFTGGVDGTTRHKIIGVVNKTNPSSDYYQLVDGPLQFVVSNAQTINEITTSIHDPNQSLARVDETSSVIYKISRQKNTASMDILGQIMQEKQGKKKPNQT